MILIAIALQYIQMKQLSGRNPAAAQANPQMQQMQKVMPLIFAVIYIAIPAGVNVYFIISSLFRISQQEFMYRHDPQIRASLEKLRERTKNDPKVIAARAVANQSSGKGLLSRLRPSALMPATDPGPGSNGGPPPKSSGPRTTPSKAAPSRSTPSAKSSGGSRPAPSSNGRRTPATPSGNGKAAPAAPKPQPRAQGKRARRPR
jgi:YidC/Oxa1 family membrane protein insertase